MSWITGYIGTPQEQVINRLDQLTEQPRFTHHENHFYVAAGGSISETCRSNLSNPREGTVTASSGWMVCGLAIDPDRHTVMDRQAWEHLLNDLDNIETLRRLDGHFILLRWLQGRLEIYNDPLGLRSCYLRSVEGGYLFSTRLDWISKVTGGSQLDLQVFGSHWLSYNQLDRACLLQEVRRLGQGARAVLTPDSLDITEQPFDPRASEPVQNPDSGRFIQQLLHPALSSDHIASLGLSGGLDSRVMLGKLLQTNRSFRLHLFGSSDDPDVKLARRIADDLGIKQQWYRPGTPSTDGLIEALQNFSSHSCAQTPASHSAKMNHYSQMRDHGLCMIDGGFGEIGRRQFFNRLVIQNALHRSPDANRLIDACRWNRPAIFSPDVLKTMESGLLQTAQQLIEEMPSPRKVGLGYYADLLSLRTRLPNTYGREQARLDGLLPNYMPFAQPSFIRMMLAIPARKKISSRLFKKMVRNSPGQLDQYPLAKNGTTYPFNLPAPLAPYWTRIKLKIQPARPSTHRNEYLWKLQDYIRDTVHSQKVRNFPLYNYKLIHNRVENYYDGQEQYASWIDWWLAFDIWRQVVLADSC